MKKVILHLCADTTSQQPWRWLLNGCSRLKEMLVRTLGRLFKPKVTEEDNPGWWRSTYKYVPAEDRGDLQSQHIWQKEFQTNYIELSNRKIIQPEEKTRE